MTSFDLGRHQRERIRELQRENVHLRTHRQKLELLIGLLCPNPKLLAELETIADQLLTPPLAA